MSEEYVKLLEATLEYGQGYREMIRPNEDEVTEIYDFTSKFKEKVLDYHLHKIKYSLGAEQNIQSLTMIYKNRNDGQQETLLDTEKSKLKGTEEEIEFEENEEIVDVYFYTTKDNILVSIMIKTNLGKIKYIGNKDKGELIKDRVLETENKIVLGFGVNAGKKHGVSSIYCYYIDKSKFGIIKYEGVLQLRGKLRVNQEFKNQVNSKKETLNEHQKLIYNVCDLPDTAFFPIASYLIHH